MQTQKKTIWKFDEVAVQQIETKLDTTDWSFTQNLSDINEINNVYTNILLETANELTPPPPQKKKFLNRPADKPWIYEKESPFSQS